MNLSALGRGPWHHDCRAGQLVSGVDGVEGDDRSNGLRRWGNPDPSSTHGKTVIEAKELELRGWPYPRHLAGRHFGLIVHGDSVGAETLRRSLSDWLTDMNLISAGNMAECDGYVGYMKPYATSHEEFDEDPAFQQDVRNAARALGTAVNLARAGRLDNPAEGLSDPVPK
jgi:hypothetical protein